MSNPIDISVVAPCYNEEEVVDLFVERAIGVCNALNASYELILIDDGSKDKTWERIVLAAQKHPSLKGIKLSRNHGHQLALTAGLSKCSGDKILIIDADLQDPPELLPAMLEKMTSANADVVYGQRMQRKGETVFKLVTAHLFYRILEKLSEIDIPRDTGDFRLMSRRALDVLLSMEEHHRFIRGMVSWIGFTQVPYLYERQERSAGVSKYPFIKMCRFAVNAITSFSIKPLRIASALGAGFGVLALLGMFYVLFGHFFLGHTVSGWTSMIVVVLLLGSVQLMALGVIGEYLGRLFIENKKRPLYIISDILGGLK